MATHPDDPKVPQPGDEQHSGAKPDAADEAATGKAPKHTKLPRQPGKPTMIQRDEDDQSRPAPVPNMSIEPHDEEIMALEPVADDTELIPAGALPADAEDIPVLEAVPDDEPTAMAVPSDIVDAEPVEEVQPVSDIAEAEAVFEEMEVEPISEVAEALPASGVHGNDRPTNLTGADMPGAEVTGAEHVLGDDLQAHPPVHTGAAGSDVVAAGEPASGVDAVLGDEPLDRGSRPSARVESPIRTEPDDDAVDLGGARAPGAKKIQRADLEATEEVLAGEPGGRGSSAINWNEIGADSGAAAKPVEDETVPYEVSGEGSSDDSLLNAEDLARRADDASAVNLGDLPNKSKSPSGIDAVAEALESGVNLDDEVPLSPTPGAASVEFDDILTDSSESMPPVKKGAPKTDASDEQLEMLAPTDDDIEPVDRAKKKRKKASADVEDEAAAALFAGTDEAEAVAVPDEDEAEAVAVPADEDEAVAAPVTDEDTDEVAAGKGKAKGDADADSEPPAKTRGKGKPAPVPAGGPSCLGRLVGAAAFMVVGIVVAIGAIAALQFTAPALLSEYLGTQKKATVVQQPQPQPTITPVQRAYSELAAGDYAQVIESLKDEADPQAVGVRGEARWLKYVKAKTEAKQPLKESDKDVQDALADLKTANNKVRADEIVHIVREPEIQKQLAQAEQSRKALTEKVAQAEVARKQADALVKDIGGVLASAKVIADPGAVSADSVRKLVKDLGESKVAVDGVNRMLQDANVKDQGPKGVAELLAAKKSADAMLTEVDKALAQAKVKDPGAKGVQELVVTRAQVQKDRDELNAAIKAAYDEMVQANVVPPGGDPRKGLAEGAKRAREKGESPLALPLANLGSALAGLSQGAGQFAAKVADTSLLAAKLAQYELREPFIHTPARNLDLYAALLQDRGLTSAKDLASIRDEARWVLDPANKVAPAARAKAEYVTGLALRNEGKFDAARKAFDSALKSPGAKGAPWQKQAQAALAELTDPHAYYLPQIERMQAAGNVDEALKATDVALKALPGDGTLLAERARLRLESFRGKGKVSDAAQKQIRGDAQAAIKSPGGAAEGEYVLGLLEEELGQYAKAETHYRAALDAHKGNDETAVRYRVALARVLLQDRPAAVAPRPADDRKGARSDSPAQAPTITVHPLTGLLLTAAIAAQQDPPEPEQENPATAKRLREALELAKVLANSKNAKVREQGYALLADAVAKAGVQLTSTSCLELAKGLVSQPDPRVRGTGMMLMGQGLVKQGKRTEGLKEYTRGMELLHPGLATREIGRMIEEHPAFQHPDAANTPNPLLAEKHFGNGLHLYWAGHYPEAESQFKQAVDYFNQDARYLYFLGLSQLAQKSKLKRDQAYYSFEQGARLEAQGRPSLADINTSLERVQGQVRQALNAYRNRGAMASAQ